MSAAEAAADLNASLVLNSQRAARLVEYHARTHDTPGLREVIDAVMAVTWHAGDREGLEREIAHTIDYVVLTRLMQLALDNSAPAEVRSIATDKVDELKKFLASSHPEPDLKYALDLIAKFQSDPDSLNLPEPAEIPPGQPIGDDEDVSPFSLLPKVSMLLKNSWAAAQAHRPELRGSR